MFGEGYTMLLMLMSIGWILTVLAKTALAVRRHTKQGTTPKIFELGGRTRVSRGSSLLVKSLVIFSAGCILLDVIQILDNALSSGDCVQGIAIACCSVKMFFIICQVMLIVNSRARVTFNKTLPNGMMVMQVIATNIIVYTWTFIKSKEGIIESEQDEQRHLPTTSSPGVWNNSLPGNQSTTATTSEGCTTTVYRHFLPWLYPFCLEFCLTASGMLAEHWMECPSDQTTESTGTICENVFQPQPRDSTEMNGRGLKKATWAGIVGTFACVAHLGVIAFLYVETDPVTAIAIWYTARATTAVIIVVLSSIGLFNLRSSNNKESSGFELDEVLLVIGTVGTLALALFRSFAGMVSLGGEDRKYAGAVFSIEVIAVAGIFLQTVFTTKALHRQAGRSRCISTASIAIVLGLLNVGIWVTNNFDVEGLDHHIYPDQTYKKISEFQTQRYGSIWVLVQLLCFPVAIFYRIHSAVVLYRVSKIHRTVTESWQSGPVSVDHVRKELLSFYNECELLSEKKNQLSHRWATFQQKHSTPVQQQYQELTHQFEQLNQQLQQEGASSVV